MHTSFYFTLICCEVNLLLIDRARYEREVTDINTESNHTLFKLNTEIMCFIVLLCSFLSYVVVHYGLIVFQPACLCFRNSKKKIRNLVKYSRTLLNNYVQQAHAYYCLCCVCS